MMTWLLSVLEIGRAVIKLRQEMLEVTDSLAHEKIEQTIRNISILFAGPNQAHLRAALDAVLAAIIVCEEMLSEIGHWNWISVAVAATALAMLYLFARLKRVPGALLVIVVGVIAGKWLDLP